MDSLFPNSNNMFHSPCIAMHSDKYHIDASFILCLLYAEALIQPVVGECYKKCFQPSKIVPIHLLHYENIFNLVIFVDFQLFN